MNKKNIEFELFTKPMFKKLLGPAIFSAFGFAFADMADAIVVGSKMQTEGLAAIGLVLPVYMLYAIFANGFGIGGSIKYAKLLAEGFKIDARDHFYSTIATAIIFGLLNTAFGLIFIDQLLAILGTTVKDGLLFTYTKDYLTILLIAAPFYYLFYILNYYLRNDNNEKIASIASVSGNIIDISLSIIFVIFLELGTKGAALATLIGYIITSSIYWYGVKFKSDTLHSRSSYFLRLSKDFYKLGFESLKMGISTSISYGYSLVFYLICNNILIKISSNVGVAVFDLIQNCSYLVYYLYDACCKATQPIISTYVSENNVKGRKDVQKYGIFTGCIIGLIMVTIIGIWPGLICKLFGVYPLIEGDIALRFFCFGSLFGGLNLMICNYYQSCEATKPVILIETLRGFGILLPVTLLCANFELNYFWLLYPITEILTLLTFVIANMVKKFKIVAEDKERVYSATVLASAKGLVDISQEIGDFCEKWDADAKTLYMIVMTVEEIGMAILTNGIKGQKDGYIQFTLIAKEDGEFRLHVRDNAPSFNPFSLQLKQEGDDDMNLDALGIEVVKKSASFFSYRQFNNYNTLVIYL